MTSKRNIENRVPITWATMLTTLMITVDSTVANVALPHIQGSLSASPDQIGWVLTSYIVASAMTTPVSGWLASRFGVKTMLLGATAGFTVASMLCGLATSLPQLVVFRLLQGAAGAFTLPLSQAVLLNINPPENHARAMSVWAMGTVLGPIIGPILGGYLTDEYSWRWCFYINLPIGALAFLGLWIFMDSEEDSSARRFDFLGFSSLIVAVAALQLMLDRGPGQDWFSSLEIWTEAIVALIGFWVFLTHTATTRHPFVDPSLIRDRNLLAGSAFSFMTQAVMFSSLAILPILTQSLLAYPVLVAGIVSIPRGLGMMLFMWLTPKLAARFDLRLLLLAGLVGNGLAFWQMMHFDLTMSTQPLVVSGFLQGAAVGLIFVALTTLAFATVPPALRPDAAALYNLIRSMGASIGISVVQAIAVAHTQMAHASLAAHVTPSDPMVRWALDRAFSPETLAGALALDREINRQAAMIAYLDDFRLMFVMTIVCAPLILLLRSVRRTPGEAAHVAVD